ncbi:MULTISPECIES: CBS domain-containing protein [Thalassoglobus]|uniref:Inosine 5'-monophosphate dehydrogenase n=1 Tax=Thalassoglobus polymorphus TaxID=2527994 RepID=A0A517QQX6_9PLAN|nr:CBS domain-containing protein [Thalassoglobus polymorphus]QDT34031.1 inosine 5'-monophosphate dehydrogenase [Thalassoglobus polymorphus]
MTHNSLTARDIMTRKVISLTPDQDLFEVMSLLVKNKISGAPVVDRNGRYLGVFSEKSSISLLMDAAERGTPTNRIEAFVDTDAETVSPGTGLLTIAQMFMSAQYRRLPVLEKGRVIGLISRRDVLKAAHRFMDPVEPSDSGILYLSSTRDRSQAPVA